MYHPNRNKVQRDASPVRVPISLTEARKQLGWLLNQAVLTGDVVVLQRHGDDAKSGAIVSVTYLDELERDRERLAALEAMLSEAQTGELVELDVDVSDEIRTKGNPRTRGST